MTMGKPTLRCWLCWIVGAIAIAFIGYCVPASAAPETESASGLLDDLSSGLFGPKKSPPPRTDDAPKLGPQQLPPPDGNAGQPAESSPLAQIAGNMKQAERLIVQQNLKGETAQVQDQVLADIDALIDQAQQQNQNNQNQQQQQQQQQASQRNTPQAGQANQPAGQPQPGDANAARTSSDQLRQSREAAAAGLQPQDLLKDVWGQLPERVRQQLLQSSTDEFLPEYRDAIELYFRRLAEEESGTFPRSDR